MSDLIRKLRSLEDQLGSLRNQVREAINDVLKQSKQKDRKEHYEPSNLDW